MQKLTVFNNVSVDGYFTDAKGDMHFAHNMTPDAEWDDYVAGNAGGDGTLVFGRVTYQMMAAFWPTTAAKERMPAVTDGMNLHKKIVFSKTLKKAEWNNTRLIKGDPAREIPALKEAAGSGLVILGSGNIVAQLARHDLIDEYQFVVVPAALGRGRTLFDGLKETVPLKLVRSRVFRNGNAVLCYEPRR